MKTSVEMQAMMHLNLSVNMKIANNLHQITSESPPIVILSRICWSSPLRC